MTDLTARLRLAATGGADVAAEAGKGKAGLDDLAEGATRAGAASRQAAAGIDEVGQSAKAAHRDLATLFDESQLDFVGMYNRGMGQAAAVNDNAARSMKAASQAGLGLSRQFADIGVTAAMGMNPLMILIGQGPQIADTMAVMGREGVTMGQAFKSMGADMGGVLRMMAPLAPAALAIGAAAGVAFGGAALAARALNKENGDLTKGMGLTEAQLKRLKDEGVETGVTIGDVFKGTFNYIAGAVGEVLAPVGRWFSELFDNVTRWGFDAAKKLVGGMVGAFEAIKATWRMFPAAFADLIITGVNTAIGAIEKLLNSAANGINALIAKANEASAKFGGPQLGMLGPVQLGRAANQSEGAAATMFNAGQAAYAAGDARGQAWVVQQARNVAGSILDATRARILDEAGDAGRSRSNRARTPRDVSDQRSAEIAAAVERARIEELQAQAALVNDTRERARIEKLILQAQIKQKQAEVEGQMARIRSDKGLTDAEKAELTERLWLVSLLQDSAGILQERALDERTQAQLAREGFAVEQARREGLIDLLQSQADASRSDYERRIIGLKILEEQHKLERDRLENITLANGYSQNEVDIARQRLAVLEQIQANERQQAEASAQLLDAITEAADAVRGFRSAFGRGDFAGALNSLLQTIQTVRAAFATQGMSGGLMTAGSAAAQIIGGRTGRAIGTGLGIASLGMSLGTMAGTLGSALSVGGSLATVGSLGMGAALTGIAGVLGPIGLAAGALYAAAKLFNVGGKPSNHGAGYDLTTGQFSGNKRNQETEQAAKAAADAILEGQAFLKAAGIELGATVRGLVVGTRDLSQIYLTNGRTLTSATGDAAAAADTALRAVLEGATYVNDAQKGLVEGMVAAGKGFDEITAALEGYAQAQKIPQQIADAILQLTDPKAWALEELKRAQEEQRDALKAARDAGYLTAAQYDAAYAQLSKLEDLQLDEVMKRFAASMEDATNLRKSVDDRILELLDPQAYQVKRINDAIDAQRAEALKLIEAGAMGSDFLGSLEQLRSLELAALAGSIGDLTDVFEQARPRLLSWLDEMRLGPSAELSPQAAKEEALRQYEAMLARARGGDADALSGITGYADRLLSADRGATSSAQDRLALFNRVQADIAGLAGMGGGAGDQLAQLAAMRASLTEIAKASNVQMMADLQATAEGGSRVLVSNIPALKDMYGEALTLQTDRLVAANDRSREEIVAALNDSAAKMAEGLAALQGAVAQGAAVTADQLASVAAYSAQQLQAAQQLAREAQLENARLRAQR